MLLRQFPFMSKIDINLDLADFKVKKTDKNLLDITPCIKTYFYANRRYTDDFRVYVVSEKGVTKLNQARRTERNGDVTVKFSTSIGDQLFGKSYTHLVVVDQVDCYPFERAGLEKTGHYIVTVYKNSDRGVQLSYEKELLNQVHMELLCELENLK